MGDVLIHSYHIGKSYPDFILTEEFINGSWVRIDPNKSQLSILLRVRPVCSRWLRTSWGQAAAAAPRSYRARS